MILTTLGKYGRYAPKNQATSGYLVQNEDTSILMDIGSGVLSRLQEFVAPEMLNAIVLTHLHFDHISDIFTLKYYLGYLQSKGKYQSKIKVFLPNEPKHIVDEILSGDLFEHFFVENGEQVVGSFKLFFNENHHPIKTFSTLVKSEGKTLFYTSDVAKEEDLRVGVDSQFCIGDAMFLDCEHNDKLPHISVKMLASKLCNCKLLLSHLPEENQEEILQEALLYNKNSEIIKEMYSYNF